MPPVSLAPGADGRWRETRGERGIAAALRAQFPAAADLLHTPDRRRFMRLMAASLALSGLAGCDDDDTHDVIVPPVAQVPGQAPATVLTYASATLLDGFANGITVRTRDGRPIKIEGNPAHPWSRGGTDIFGQASVLGLYDPFRSQTVQFQTRDSDWPAFRAAMLGPQAQWRATRGAGLSLLLGPGTSPSLAAQIATLRQAWPELRVFTHGAVPRDALYESTRLAFGRRLETHWRLDDARAIVCLDGDLLDPGPHQVGAAKGWSAARRRVAQDGGLLAMHAAYAVPNLTSAKAEHAICAQPALIEAMARSLLSRATAGGQSDLPEAAAAWCNAAWRALDGARGAGVVQAGLHASPGVHEAVQRLNAALGNTGRTVLHTQPLQGQGESLAALVDAMRQGAVSAVVMIGTNPCYDSAAGLGFTEALAKVALKIHASLYEDETSVNADWHLPMAHPLESWGDARALDGTASLIQPTIAPLYDGRTAGEIVSILTEPEPRDAHTLLAAHWNSSGGEARWHDALLSGVIAGGAAPLVSVQQTGGMTPATSAPTPGTQIVFRPDPTVWDGTVADNAWLQELPKPLSKVVLGERRADRAGAGEARRSRAVRCGDCLGGRAQRDRPGVDRAEPGRSCGGAHARLRQARGRPAFRRARLRRQRAARCRVALAGGRRGFASRGTHACAGQHGRSCTYGRRGICARPASRRAGGGRWRPRTAHIISQTARRWPRLGHGDRPRYLHRLQCLRHRLPEREQHRRGRPRRGTERAGNALAAGGCVSGAGRRHRHGADVHRVHAGAVHAVRTGALRSRLPC